MNDEKEFFKTTQTINLVQSFGKHTLYNNLRIFL